MKQSREMTSLLSFGQPTPTISALPVAIDYPAALGLRQMATLVDELPRYLLTPEVSAPLHFMPDLRHKMLFTTLWNTGARISEALVLARGDFMQREHYPFVQLATLKQREEKAERRAGALPHRLVPCPIAWCHCLTRSTSHSWR